MWGLRFGVLGSEFRVQGLGVMAYSLGSGLRVKRFRHDGRGGASSNCRMREREGGRDGEHEREREGERASEGKGAW